MTRVTDKNNEFQVGLNNMVDFLIYLYKKKYILLIVPFFVGLFSYLYLLTLPNTYTSKATFIPPPTELISDYKDELSNLSLNNSLSIGPRGFDSMFKNPSQSYIEILKSRVIREPIINNLNLKEEFKTDDIEDLLKKLDKIINIKENSGLLELNVETNDPKLSQEIINESLVGLAKTLDKLSNKSISSFLDQRIKNIHKKLIEARIKLRDYQLKTKTVNVEQQSQELIKQISTLQSQYIIVESELKSLQELYTANSIKVKSAIAKLNSLKTKLNKLQRENNSNDIESISDMSILDLPNVGINYVEYARDATILEQLYLLLIKEYEMSKIKEAKGALKLKIIDNANLATKKSGPKKLVKTVLAILLSFIMTLIFISFMYFISIIKYKYPDTYNKLKYNK